jgi:hypothetical protein
MVFALPNSQTLKLHKESAQMPQVLNKFIANHRLVDEQGLPTQVFYQYMTVLDAILRSFTGGSSGLTNAANDAAAAAAGVAIGQFYANAGAVKIRLT